MEACEQRRKSRRENQTDSQMTPFRENLRGIALIMATNLLFVSNDTLVKLAGEEMPLSQVLFIRGIFATMILLPMVYISGAHRHFPLLVSWPVFWRTVAEIFAALTYLLALFHIPIANANTISQIVPLIITACGALFFREAVGWRRWTAIVVGFVGVLIVMRPGFEGFNSFSLLALASAFFVTLRDMCTRVMSPRLPALLIALLTAVAVGASGPVFAPVLGETWVAPTPRGLTFIACAIVFLIGGYISSVGFMRHGDISVVAPFRYTIIIWAMIIGYIVWREVPDMPMIIGTIVIAASGVYTFSRERSQALLREKAAAGEGL